MQPIEVFPIGTRISIGPGDGIPALISCISISENGVKYEVTWWDGRTRKSEYMFVSEFKVQNNLEVNRIPIGFGVKA